MILLYKIVYKFNYFGVLFIYFCHCKLKFMSMFATKWSFGMYFLVGIYRAKELVLQKRAMHKLVDLYQYRCKEPFRNLVIAKTIIVFSNTKDHQYKCSLVILTILCLCLWLSIEVILGKDSWGIEKSMTIRQDNLGISAHLLQRHAAQKI